MFCKAKVGIDNIFRWCECLIRNPGIEANAGVSFSRGDYTGNPRNITSNMLRGHTFGVSAGLGLGIDGSLGISYAPVNI